MINLTIFICKLKIIINLKKYFVDLNHFILFFCDLIFFSCSKCSSISSLLKFFVYFTHPLINKCALVDRKAKSKNIFDIPRYYIIYSDVIATVNEHILIAIIIQFKFSKISAQYIMQIDPNPLL